MIIATLFDIEIKVYEFIFVATFALLLLIGLFSAFHLKLSWGWKKEFLTDGERSLLGLPGVWLTSSMWLNYFNNAAVALSVACSVAVVVMTAFEETTDVARTILYTLIALVCSLLINFTHSREKSEGYRKASNYMRPICEQFEYRYTKNYKLYNSETREKDFKSLVNARVKAEEIIQKAHSYSPEKLNVSYPSL